MSRLRPLVLSALCLALAAETVLAAPRADLPIESASGTWEGWQVAGEGFVARRRVPARFELPADLRRAESTAEKAFERRRPRQPAPNVSAWLQTGLEGLYGVDLATLAAQANGSIGALRAAAQSGRLSLTSAGSPVPWHYDADRSLVVFPAPAYETFQTEGNAFHFQQTRVPDSYRMAESGSGGVKAGEPEPFRELLRFEDEADMLWVLWLYAANPDGRYWFWDYLYGSYRPQLQVPLVVPDPAPAGVAQVRIKLHGFTNLYPGDEHHVAAAINGVTVGSTLVWDGLRVAELVADFDQALLNDDGLNSLTLTSAYDASRPSPGQFLESVELEYSRLPVARDGQLWLRGAATTQQVVTGLSSPEVLVIRAPSGAATVMRDVTVFPDGDGWAVAFPAKLGGEYLIAELSAVLAPAIDTLPAGNLTAAGRGASYLIIAAREFPETAEALATRRKASHGSAAVVWLDDIYKEFGHGRREPAAIAEFMAHVQTKWSPQPSVVTLIGKGSLDRKDRMGYGDNFLPVVMTSNPWALAPSDARLLGAPSGRAPFAYGRIPIASDAEGLAYLAKLDAHENGFAPSAGEAVVVADNPDAAGDFHVDADGLSAQLLGLGMTSVTKLYHPNQAVRTVLGQTATWDKSFVSYSGHGSARQLGTNAENFVNADSAALLRNSVYPIFAALTCSAGLDAQPGMRSLAAALVLNPDGGAIASVAPTGASLNWDAHVLGGALVDRLVGDRNPAGEALKEAVVDTEGVIWDFMAPMYTVVGDPAAATR